MDASHDAQLPEWMTYPSSYLRVLEQGVVNLHPWHLMNKEQSWQRYHDLQVRYPDRQLFPFARRGDNDDLACWERDKGSQIVVIHDYASRERLDRARYAAFWDWFRAAVEDMIVFESDA